MPRPVMLGIVGDSGSGKTTITRGLVRVLGEDQVTHFCTDDYHRYDRRQRAERNITPLDPECNHLDILAQHLRHLKAKEPIMKPVYQHTDGTFGAARVLRAGPVPRLRRAARLLQPRARGQLRRARVPRPARGAAPPLEGAARLLAARVHDRPGALRARPARARLRAVHPAAAPSRGHRRLLPAGRDRGSGAPRLQADALRLASPPRPDRRRERERRGRDRAERAARGRRSSTSPGSSRPSAPR